MAWSSEVLSSLTKGDADRWNGADADRTANEEADRRKAGDVTLQWGGTEGRRGGDDMAETTTKLPVQAVVTSQNVTDSAGTQINVFFIK
tara:strand:+ start:799 stop:1065 length:267 start_codon:yes stop_codon:yes gene_type:complete